MKKSMEENQEEVVVPQKEVIELDEWDKDDFRDLPSFLKNRR